MVVRKLWLATAIVAGLAGASPAEAQQRVWQGGRWVSMPHRSAPPRVSPGRSQRWPMVNGRWNAGWQAPGGWNSYHRLGRGARIDRYWMDYRVPDYLSFGLAAPPRGYSWVRYYDDAVLVDDGGNVWDSVGGIAWSGESYGDGYSSSESYAVAGVGAGYRQPIAPVDPNVYYDDDAPAYGGPQPGHDAPIPYPPQHQGGYPPPPQVQVQTYPGNYQGQAYQGQYQGGAFLGGNAYQGGSSYYSSGGYAYGGGTTTTVVITPAPITTTTVIEEVVQESTVTSYVRKAPRRIVRKAPVKRWRPKPKCCVCGC